METRTYEVYKYNELPEKLKEKVLENYYDINVNYDWWEFIEEDFKNDLLAQGYGEIELNFSGFHSQGDGASFVTDRMDLVKWLAHNKRTTYYKSLLAPIEDERIYARINRTTHHYYHENTCEVSVYGEDLTDKQYALTDELSDEIEADRKNLCREIYDRLQDSYGELTSDREIIETIKANDYDFNEEGKID